MQGTALHLFGRSYGLLTCLEDLAMRSGGPGSSGSSLVLLGGPFGSCFLSEGASGFMRSRDRATLTRVQSGPVARSGAVGNQGPFIIASGGPYAPKWGSADSGALANWFALPHPHSKIPYAATVLRSIKNLQRMYYIHTLLTFLPVGCCK